MKKNNPLIKFMILIFILSSFVTIFAGCQNKNSQNTSVQTANPSGNNRINTEERKKQLQDDIKPLITDGTITQDQADKIIEALTTNNQRAAVQRRSQNDQQNNTNNNFQNNAQGNNQNRQRFNPLSQLVSNGVITQAQADAVMEKIRGNFQRPQNSNYSTQNNNNSNN